MPGQTGEVPVTGPGVAGVAGLTTTGKLEARLVPQELVAVTVIEFVPDPAVINHPVGTVQLYEDAVATDVIV